MKFETEKHIGTVSNGIEDLFVYKANYPNGALAIVVTLQNKEPYAKLSVNVASISERLLAGEFIVNHNMTNPGNEGVLDLLSTLFEDTGKRICYGYVQDQPVWKIKEGQRFSW